MLQKPTLLGVSLFFSLFCLHAPLARAAVISVNATCSLPNALIAANTDSAVGGCSAGSGADSITLTADVVLTVVNNSDQFTGDNGLPVVISEITIVGNGFALKRDPVAPNFRLLQIDGGFFGAGQLTVENLALQHGKATAVANALGCESFGGAILNRGGIVNIIASTLSENEAECGGALVNFPGGVAKVIGATFGGTAPNRADFGGAIWNLGFLPSPSQLLVRKTLFLGNVVPLNGNSGEGGAIWNQATAEVVDSGFVANQAGCGGAVSNTTIAGNIRFINTEFRDNTAASGGAIWNFNASDMEVKNSLLESNTVEFTGVNCAFVGGVGGGAIHTLNNADLFLTDTVIQGNQTRQFGFLHGGGIAIGQNGRTTIENSLVTDNTSSGDGGGIRADSVNQNVPVEIVNSRIVDNTALRNGGGIEASSLPMTIRASAVSDNLAKGFEGGGINYEQLFNVPNILRIEQSEIRGNMVEGGSGGGVQNDDFGIVEISESTIADNQATGVFGFGGGINNDSSGQMTIANSTISANVGQFGGGIHNNNAGQVSIVHSTIVDNSSFRDAGIRALATVRVRNSIVANNTATSGDGSGDCLPGFPPVDDGNNLQSDGTCGTFTNTTLAELNLGPLTDNGGATLTHALGVGSFAIDGIGGQCVEVQDLDQRGASRDALCDIGSFEAGPILPRISFAQGTTTVWENLAGTVPVQLILDNTLGNLQGETVSAYLTIRGSAAPEYDYNTLTARPVPIAVPAPGTKTIVDFNIEVVDDADAEGDETIELALAYTGPAVRGGQTAHRVNIRDNDGEDACSELHLFVQQQVGDEDPRRYKNHGQYVKAVIQVLKGPQEPAARTEGCHGCIVSQFARRIATVDQVLCQSEIRP